MESPEPDRFYTPQRVRALLREYGALLDRRSDDAEDPIIHVMRVSPSGPLERRMCIRADLQAAFTSLRDPLARQIIYRRYIQPDPDSVEHLAAILRVHRVTVFRYERDALELMAHFLGNRDMEAWRAQERRGYLHVVPDDPA